MSANGLQLDEECVSSGLRTIGKIELLRENETRGYCEKAFFV